MPDPADLACQEFVEVVTAYLEGALDRRTRRRFEAHLAACDGCDAYLEQIRMTIAVSGRLRADALTPELRDALGGLFRGWATRR